MSSTERLEYFTAFHKACHNDRFIWGGCNTELVQLLVLLQSTDTRFSVGQALVSSAVQPAFSDDKVDPCGLSSLILQGGGTATLR